MYVCYVEETEDYVFFYKYNVLESCAKQYAFRLLADNKCKNLKAGLKRTFDKYLKHMLQILLESPDRSILFHNQKIRVHLDSSDTVEKNDLDKSKLINKCVDDQLLAWEGKINLSNIFKTWKEMKYLFKDFYPDE